MTESGIVTAKRTAMMEVTKGPGVLQLLTCRRRLQAKGDLHPSALQVAILCSIRIMLPNYVFATKSETLLHFGTGPYCFCPLQFLNLAPTDWHISHNYMNDK